MADCFFHTGRPAVARCKQCGRSLCNECRKIKDNGIFCSDKCMEAFGVFAHRAEQLDEKRARKSPAAGVIKFILVVVVLYVIYALLRRFLLK